MKHGSVQLGSVLAPLHACRHPSPTRHIRQPLWQGAHKLPCRQGRQVSIQGDLRRTDLQFSRMAPLAAGQMAETETRMMINSKAASNQRLPSFIGPAAQPRICFQCRNGLFGVLQMTEKGGMDSWIGNDLIEPTKVRGHWNPKSPLLPPFAVSVSV